MLADSYGRVATDLRVSLTDRCNLRCAYCMPPEGLDWLPTPELLTDDELLRLITIAVQRLGITEVRFTGGEPLLRRGLAGIVARTAELDPRPEISLTTNAIGLARTAATLREAGLDRINVSLDTLRPETFRKLTRRDRLPDVLDGLAAAAAAGLAPVKVNTVLMRDLNDDEAVPLLRYCLERGYELRFIEQMPLDAQHGWRRDEMVTADEILTALRGEYDIAPDDERERGSAPAQTFLVNGGPARVGVIASVTRPFCGTCDRVRLTADGQIRNCLFARTENDLRGPLRAGASDAELAERWRRAVAVKLPGHGINDPSFLQPDRPMSAIGGLRMTGGITPFRFEVIVLAGGGAVRLAGKDKPGMLVGGMSLLESVLAAGAGAQRAIVVGPAREGVPGVLFVSERPPGSGPVPALRRGLAEVSTSWVAVLAADLPFLRDVHLAALLRAAEENGTGAVLADDTGHAQWLAGCWRSAALRAALDGYAGGSLRGVLGPLEPTLLRLDPGPGEAPPWLDCDTPEDLESARRLVP